MKILLSAFLLAAAGPGPDPRAQEVLAQARQALGSRSVRGLSLEADLRRVQPLEGGETRDLSGEVTVDVLLPDRYLKVETLSPMPGGPAISIGTGLDGQEAWRAPLGTPASGHVVVRVPAGDGPGAAGALLRRTRSEMLRVVLLALASAEGEGGWTLTHAGEAEAPEGRADRIEASDGDGVVGTLFVDKATHLPLFAQFKTTLPRMQMMRATGAQDAERLRRQAEAQAQAASPPPEAEARLFVSDWKVVDGLKLPHRLTQSVEGGATEEWTVRRWKVDPTFKPGHFKKQK
jgi:hypothetical protein